MSRVLVIEDSPTQARKVALILEDAGFDVELAEQLSEGLARIAGGGIDVLLLDLTLPDSEGLETFLRVRAKAPHVPTVVFTGIDEESLAAATLRNGAQDYLVKGQVTNGWLARSLRYAVERHRAEPLVRPSPAAPPEELPVLVNAVNNVTVVRILERRLIDDVRIEQTGHRLARMIEHQGCRQMLLDFSEVEYLSNVALGMLVMLTKKTKTAQGTLRLCGIRPELHEHFVVRRLDRMFDILPDQQTALASF